MLSGSAILRVVILLAVTALLASAFQMLRPHGRDAVEPPVAKPVPETGKAGTQAAFPPAAARPVVPVDPSPARQAAAAIPLAPAARAVTPSPAAPNSGAPGSVSPGTGPLGAVPPPPTPANRAAAETGRPANPMTGEAAIDNAAETAGPRGIAIVDLNTASVTDLNGLKGGGMIGRAIAQRRPYASVSELLSRRVLSRSTYERIKDQVTVR